RLHGRSVTHVGLDGHAATARLRHQLLRLQPVLFGSRPVERGLHRFGDIAKGDIAPFAGEGQRVAPSLPPGATGDEGHLAVELSHASPPSPSDRIFRQKIRLWTNHTAEPPSSVWARARPRGMTAW